MNAMELRGAVDLLRERLEEHFSAETAAPGYRGVSSSTGHCAAVAVIVHESLGGHFVSAPVREQSHWFNRIVADGIELDVDLTGDQFGKPSVQIGRPGTLYGDTRIRRPPEVSEETIQRARVLAQRAGLVDTAKAIAGLRSMENPEGRD